MIEHKYRVENRYQDSGWSHLKDFDNLEAAIVHASISATDAMVYGMTRVIEDTEVLITFWAGYDLPVAEPMHEGNHNVQVVLSNKILDWGYRCIAPYGTSIFMLDTERMKWSTPTSITIMMDKCHVRHGHFETILHLANPDLFYNIVTILDECQRTCHPPKSPQI